MDNSDVISVLNELIETSKDGEFGFTNCAERANSADLKQTLSRRAADCEAGAKELQALVAQHGGKAEDGGHDCRRDSPRLGHGEGCAGRPEGSGGS
jgi:hypothetical protein